MRSAASLTDSAVSRSGLEFSVTKISHKSPQLPGRRGICVFGGRLTRSYSVLGRPPLYWVMSGGRIWLNLKEIRSLLLAEPKLQCADANLEVAANYDRKGIVFDGVDSVVDNGIASDLGRRQGWWRRSHNISTVRFTKCVSGVNLEARCCNRIPSQSEASCPPILISSLSFDT